MGILENQTTELCVISPKLVCLLLAVLLLSCYVCSSSLSNDECNSSTQECQAPLDACMTVVDTLGTDLTDNKSAATRSCWSVVCCCRSHEGHREAVQRAMKLRQPLLWTLMETGTQSTVATVTTCATLAEERSFTPKNTFLCWCLQAQYCGQTEVKSHRRSSGLLFMEQHLIFVRKRF